MATAKTPKAEEKKAAYIVTSPLRHGVLVKDDDGKDQSVETNYAVGDEIELTNAEAMPLLGHTVKPKKAS